jgi:hypothetical protein
MATFPDIEVGDPVTADLLSSMTVKTYTKTSSTARNTTTTHAADPELTGIPLEVGTHRIELLMYWTQTTTLTQDIKTRWSFTGTWSNPVRACIGGGRNATGDPFQVDTTTMSAHRLDDQDAIYSQNFGGNYGCVREVAMDVVVTVAGTMSLTWAQNASSGNNTTVHASSGFETRRVG